ncbi:MAG: translocation/assembly module TamB domain-containing protein [Rhodanobacter sp.]
MALTLATLLLLALLAAWWLLGSAAGARFALARVHGLTDGAVSVQHVEGRLLGSLDLTGIRYDDGKGTQLSIATATVELRAWPLLYGHLWVHQLRAEGVALSLPENPQSASRTSGFSLDPPLDFSVDQAHIGAVKVRRGTETLFASSSLDASGSWTQAGLVVTRFDLRAADGYAKVQANVQPPAGYRGATRASFAWKFGDTQYAGALTARSDGTRAHLSLNLIRPLATQLQIDAALGGNYAWTASLDAPRSDPAPLLGATSIKSVAAALNGHGDGRAGTVAGRVDINDYQLQLQPLRARFNDDFSTLQIEQLAVTSPHIAGLLQASGSMKLDGRPMHGALALHWKDVILPPELAGQTLLSTGHLDARGSIDTYHAEGDIELGPPGKLGKLSLNLDGNPKLITLHSLALQQARGDLQAHGTLSLQPVLAWQAQASAHRFDPGQLFAEWKGALDFDIASSGSLPATGPDAGLEIRKLGGTLRAHTLSGSGKLHLSSAKVLDGQLTLVSGRSKVHLRAQPGTSNRIDLVLASASLDDWLPGASGKLDGHFSVAGKWPALSINGQLQGMALNWQQQRVDSLHLLVGIPDTTRIAGQVDLRTAGVHARGLTFQSANVHAEGSQRDHRLAVSVRGTQLSGELVVHGALRSPGTWNGTLSTLKLEPQGMPAWHLQSPVELAYNRGALSVAELCLSAGEPRLCAAATRSITGVVDAHYSLHALPLALLMNAAGQAGLPLHADGTLEGSGNVRVSTAGVLTGNADIASAEGSVTYTDRPDQPLLRYEQLSLQGRFTPSEQHIEAHAALDGGGRVDGQLAVTGAEHALAGQLALRMDSLAFIELLDDDLANVNGKLDGSFQFAGTLRDPVVVGQAAVDDFAGEVPALGLKFSQGMLAVSAAGPGQPFRVAGRVQSGTGKLTISGTAGIGAGAPVVLALDGSRVTAIDIPAAKVVVSPQLKVGKDADGLHITGTLAIDSADLDIDKLPGAGATRASPDVVVVDEKGSEKAASKLPVSARVKIDLGNKTHLVAKGLDGRVSGVLTVNERPGQATTGEGQIAVDGTYRAYGQDLHINHGLLLFASTPIDNPGLNIRAVRDLNPNATINEGQEVGLLISGTAQRPILTVFSKPAMEQSDALSYLVTGKPLSSVNAGEGDLVNSAAQALGSAAGNLLAKRVGAQLGIDDIGVSSSAALGGNSAFTVGKYLSPRLYLSYGIGLFEPGEVITLRYRLSQRWNLEAQQATDFSRASLNYRIER